jgi:hypothetical protein
LHLIGSTWLTEDDHAVEAFGFNRNKPLGEGVEIGRPAHRQADLGRQRSTNSPQAANWLTTSHTDNYGSGSLDSTSFSGSGDYSGFFGGYSDIETESGTAHDNNSSLTSQTFDITVNYGAGGSSITSGTGTGHQAVSDTFSYDENGNPTDSDYSLSGTYTASGNATTSSVIDTTWKYDPSGSWRAAETHEVDAGSATNTDDLTQTVGATDDSTPEQSTVSDDNSYSYSRDLTVTTDPLGGVTISGSDTGAGTASGIFTSSGSDDSTDDTYEYTGGGNQAYSNNGPTGAWTGTETETEIEDAFTWSDTWSTTGAGFHGDPHLLANSPMATGSGIWGEEQPQPSAVGTPPSVNAPSDPYWSNVFAALPGAIADTVSSDASAVWSFLKSPQAAIAAAGFIPVVGNFIAAASDIYHGNYGFAALDVGSILFDETGAGEAEAEARIVVNIGGDLEKANAAAREGTQVAGDVSLTDQIIQNQCFIAGTQVVVAIVDSEAGTDATEQAVEMSGAAVAVAAPSVRYITQSIEKISRRELIVTRDQFDPEAPNILREVEEVFERIAHGLTIVTLRSSTGRLQTLQTTSEHPVYVPGRGWVVCRELAEGDELVEPTGGITTVVSARHETHREGVLVYNFSVSQAHTYFVREQGSTAEPVWVHNSSCDAAELAHNLEAEGEVRLAGEDAAHIVPTGEFTGRSAEVQAYISFSQQVLEYAGIDLNDAANGFFTEFADHAATHTDAYFEGVARLLSRTDGSTQQVLAALQKLKTFYGG